MKRYERYLQLRDTYHAHGGISVSEEARYAIIWNDGTWNSIDVFDTMEDLTAWLNTDPNWTARITVIDIVDLEHGIRFVAEPQYKVRIVPYNPLAEVAA